MSSSQKLKGTNREFPELPLRFSQDANKVLLFQLTRRVAERTRVNANGFEFTLGSLLTRPTFSWVCWRRGEDPRTPTWMSEWQIEFELDPRVDCHPDSWGLKGWGIKEFQGRRKRTSFVLYPLPELLESQRLTDKWRQGHADTHLHLPFPLLPKQLKVNAQYVKLFNQVKSAAEATTGFPSCATASVRFIDEQGICLLSPRLQGTPRPPSSPTTNTKLSSFQVELKIPVQNLQARNVCALMLEPHWKVGNFAPREDGRTDLDGTTTLVPSAELLEQHKAAHEWGADWRERVHEWTRARADKNEAWAELTQSDDEQARVELGRLQDQIDAARSAVKRVLRGMKRADKRWISTWMKKCVDVRSQWEAAQGSKRDWCLRMAGELMEQWVLSVDCVEWQELTTLDQKLLISERDELCEQLGIAIFEAVDSSSVEEMETEGSLKKRLLSTGAHIIQWDVVGDSKPNSLVYGN